MNPVLLLEMNEIPWRVVDFYRDDVRFPHIHKFFSQSRTYTTIAVDSGELSPWVTWPSLHRGLPNGEHEVYNLGQDPATFKGIPVWEEYRRKGLSIGIFGSMQSWPPKDPGVGGFYIPDTFAHDARCIPAYLEPLQAFNLGQVKRNGRVVKSGMPSFREILGLTRTLPRLGWRLSTLYSLVRQIIGERLDKSFVARRPIFQTILFWDTFKSLYDPKAPPAFSTFFTNHVAGVMHRYWDHIFPQDFSAKQPPSRVHKITMDFAMGYVDKILADAMRFQAANPKLIVIFASSMGQAAVHRDEHEGYEASVPDYHVLLQKLGAPRDAYRSLLAMVPQIAVNIADNAVRGRIKKALEACHTRSGALLFSVKEIGSSLSITIRTPRLPDIQAGGFFEPAGGWLEWRAAGIAMNPVDPGTAYHIPEGTLAVRREKEPASDARTSIRADAVKSLILELAGLQEGNQQPRQP
jgi:hypothetical protein